MLLKNREYPFYAPYMIRSVSGISVVNLAAIRSAYMEGCNIRVRTTEGATLVHPFPSFESAASAFTDLEDRLYNYVNPLPWHIRLWRKIRGEI